jgi:hypothetical protein
MMGSKPYDQASITWIFTFYTIEGVLLSRTIVQMTQHPHRQQLLPHQQNLIL